MNEIWHEALLCSRSWITCNYYLFRIKKQKLLYFPKIENSSARNITKLSMPVYKKYRRWIFYLWQNWKFQCCFRKIMIYFVVMKFEWMVFVFMNNLLCRYNTELQMPFLYITTAAAAAAAVIVSSSFDAVCNFEVFPTENFAPLLKFFWANAYPNFASFKILMMTA